MITFRFYVYVTLFCTADFLESPSNLKKAWFLFIKKTEMNKHFSNYFVF